jgi:2-amino-4-hydroxy-6-hydroxymethyldihydropteridine diphosphokinase
VELLKATPQIRALAVSSIRPSKPAGGPEGQDEFLNAAARLETSLLPEDLLSRLLAIEDKIGRVREQRWGPRVIDLDLLLYDRVELKSPTLELPHPRMCYRRFVLEPAAEIAAEMVWPVNGWSVKQLLVHLDSTARYIAVGCVREDFERIIGQLRSTTDCRVVNEFSHEDALLEVLGTDAIHPSRQWVPPDHWMENVLDLECQKNAESLAMATWPQDRRWTLSDFWAEFEFDAATSLLELSGAGPDSEVFGKLRDYRLLVQKPRLVILLDDGDSALAGAYRRIDQLRRHANCPPSLWLSMDDPVRVEREVLAAMQAME